MDLLSVEAGTVPVCMELLSTETGMPGIPPLSRRNSSALKQGRLEAQGSLDKRANVGSRVGLSRTQETLQHKLKVPALPFGGPSGLPRRQALTPLGG